MAAKKATKKRAVPATRKPKARERAPTAFEDRIGQLANEPIAPKPKGWVDMALARLEEHGKDNKPESVDDPTWGIIWAVHERRKSGNRNLTAREAGAIRHVAELVGFKRPAKVD